MTTSVLTTTIDSGSPLRFILATPVAAFVTVVLITFMYKLVVTNFVAPEEIETPTIPDVSWEERVIVDQIDTSKPEKEDTTPPPPAPIPSEDPVLDPADITVPTGFKDNVVEEFNPGFLENGMPIARVMVGAKYPSRAIAGGIEGFVDVRFDVAASGATENLQVVGFEPSTIFNKEALRAVSKWKFQPKMVNGQPVKFEGLVKRIRFEMQK